LDQRLRAEDLVAVGQNIGSSGSKAYFVAHRGEALCWGLLEQSEGGGADASFDYLCSDDDLERALQLPSTADSRSQKNARACEAGDLDACVGLALSFERAQNGLSLDPGRFMRLFDEACREGNAVGCLRQARHYTTRTMIPPDQQQALELYLGACAQGLMTSCTSGLMLGVESSEAVEAQTVQQLAQVACDLSHADGCNTLGVMLHRGVGGPVDLEASSKAFRMACQLGSTAGCENLEREQSK